VELTDRIIPSRGLARSGPGRPPAVTDAELVCLAVAQVLLRHDDERRWQRAAPARVGHLFPRLLRQSEPHPGVLAHRRRDGHRRDVGRTTRSWAASRAWPACTTWMTSRTPGPYLGWSCTATTPPLLRQRRGLPPPRHRRGGTFGLARVKQDLLVRLHAFGLAEKIGTEMLFPTLPTAVAAYERWAAEYPLPGPGGG